MLDREPFENGQTSGSESQEAAFEIERQSAYLAQKWRGRRPLAKLFQTEFGNYLYDPGTNKLLQCNDVTFVALQHFQMHEVATALQNLSGRFSDSVIAEALQDIIHAIDDENILLADPKTVHFESLHFSQLEREVDENLGILILEITEKCNLRCAYCVYNEIVQESRNHGTKQMPLSTAYKAIKYIAEHSSRQRSPAVTFYGGEPLTRFPFIVKCVEYSHQAFGERTPSFSVTTNGTIVTAEIARFLATERFNVTVSIDGPKEIHDEYRVYRTGRGSFDKAIRGLRHLVDAYGERANEKLILSMVYTPPFSSKRLDQIAELWKAYPWIRNIRPTMTYPQAGSIPIEKISTKEDLMEDKPLYNWAEESYSACYETKKQTDVLTKEIIDRALLRIFRRPIFDQLQNSVHLNGCCVPGSRKIYVTTDGNIAVCERVHKAPPYIGHIDTGIDIDVLRREFVYGYAEKSLGRCADCWAHRLCGVCYIDAFSNQEYDDRRKSSACERVREATERSLKLYSKLLHVDPRRLNYLADVEVS